MPTTIIVGAGIIGISSAYFLSRNAPPNHEIHLVEAAPELFSSASGKAAGFLAKDWFSPAVASLGELSFELHRVLAAEHDGHARWGYSQSVSYSLDQSDNLHANSSEASAASSSLGNGGLDWLLSGVSRATTATSGERTQSETLASGDLPPWLLAMPEALEELSDRTSTAQVVPRRLCEFLLEQCLAAGVSLHQPARATMFAKKEGELDNVKLVRVEYMSPQSESSEALKTVDIPCENIVIAAGCWTPRAYATLFPKASLLPITHLAGYSVTLQSKHWLPSTLPSDGTELSSGVTTSSAIPGSTPCHAVFMEAWGFSPEIFSRANGDIWLGGLNPQHTALPALPTDARLDPTEVDRLLIAARTLCGDDIEAKGQTLCFRPVTASGKPIIARVDEEALGEGLELDGGVFIASGHGPWGISLSLGTGLVVAEMVLGRETSADVSQLSQW